MYVVVWKNAYILVMEKRQDTLLKEWHPRNEKRLTDYGEYSHAKVWWKCTECSHEWQATIGNRRRKSNCPECRKRRARGSNNPKWTGYGEISGRQWCKIRMESTTTRNRRSQSTIPFEITIEYAWTLFLEQNRQCALSGEPLMMWGKIDGKYTGTASLDRIDLTKGYVVGNVQWIDKKLQRIKATIPDSEFIDICRKVTAYQHQRSMPPRFVEWVNRGV